MLQSPELTEISPEVVASSDEIAQARQLDFALASPDFNTPDVRDERGALVALALGVKPAVGTDRALVEKIDPMVRKTGVETITGGDNLQGGFIVNTRALERRIAEEPELATEVGWDNSKNLTQNLQEVSLRGASSTEAQMRAGFVLGYPATALREYRDFTDYRKKRIPVLQDFWRAADFPEEAEKLQLPLEIPLVAAAFQQICAERKQTTASLAGVRDESLRNERYRELALRTCASARSLMENCFKERYDKDGLSIDKAVDTYSRIVAIKSPGGDSVYHFNVFSEDAIQADDIRALKSRVEEAFTSAGLE